MENILKKQGSPAIKAEGWKFGWLEVWQRRKMQKSGENIHLSAASLRKFALRNLPLKSFLFSFFIAACLFFAPQKAAAQNQVNTFGDFYDITTSTDNFNIELADNISFSTGGFNILSGTITGHGYTLDGGGNAPIKILGGGTEQNVLFIGDITFNNFSNSIAGVLGSAAQGGGLFVAGSTQTNAGAGVATVAFLNSTVNIINSSAETSIPSFVNYGQAAQGGGLFAGGSVSGGTGADGTNISDGGAAAITFTSSTVNITSNSAANFGSVSGASAQGGGLFAGGSVSGGAYGGSAVNISSAGAATITFTSSTVNITSNSAVNSGGAHYGMSAQGGGLFAGGSVSGGTGADGTNISDGGAVTITFTSSTVNITSNSAANFASINNLGTAAQGGGLFAGGSVSGAALGGGTNISSAGAATITFTSSTVDIIGNNAVNSDYVNNYNNLAAAAQGGGLFAGGSVSVGASNETVNIGSAGAATITFTGSAVNIASNSAVNSASKDNSGAVAQGGGLFAGGSVSGGAYNNLSYVAGGTNISSAGAATIMFTSSTVDITNNSANNYASSYNCGTAAQGGGLFAGGSVSGGAYIGGSMNVSDGGTTTIMFANSIVNIANNGAENFASYNLGTAAQGGGLFAGGSVSEGVSGNANSGSINISSAGTTTITFTSSTVNITSNSVANSGGSNYGTAAQGGGLFAAGTLSGGAYDTGRGGINVSSAGATTIIMFTSSTVDISGNSAVNSVSDYNAGTAAQGGGLFAGGSVSGGTYGSNGSAVNISSAGTATIMFTSSTVDITSNSVSNSGSNYGSAAQGGGLFAGGSVSGGTFGSSGGNINISSAGATTITFATSTVNITGNSASNSGISYGAAAQGGGLFAGGSVSGGAYSGKGANISSGGVTAISFTSSKVNISGNQATSDSGETNAQGGAIFLGGSVSAGADSGGVNVSSDGKATIDFTDSNIEISNNTAGLGGAIFAAGSVATDSGTASNGNAAMNFTNSTINFTGNVAASSGGAIYASGNFSADSALASGGAAVINFTSAAVSFTSNTAVSGGAICAVSGSSVAFDKNTTVEFLWNNSTGDNGVVYWDASSYMGLQNAKITRAIGNQANNGGFLYLDNQGTWNFANVEMSSNTARSGDGGALYLNNTTVNFTGASVFTGNQAAGSGGAIYMAASAAAFDTSGGEILFSGNTANAVPNDIYMDVNSQLDISGANAIRFEDGIVTSTDAAGIAVNKNGTGAMYLGGDNQVWGDFNINGGDIVMLDSATYRGKALEVSNGSSILDMHNATVNTVIVDGNFATDTNLIMDVFSDGTNDSITAASANIGGNIDIYAGLGTYKAKEYDLIMTSASLFGAFASTGILNASNFGTLTYDLIYDYDNGIVKLILNGKSVTNFQAIEPLSYNQKQTAKTFDKLSENPGQWNGILEQMRTKQSSGTPEGINEVKDFLAQTSGYFLSNVIRNMAADSPNNEVYDKIRNHAQEHITNSGLWIQLRGGLETFKEDENSLRDYRDLSYGVMLGFDRFLADKVLGGDLMWGVYGRFNKNNITQGLDKADGTNNGLGLYGGYIRDSWELKAMVLGSYDMFSTERAELGPVSKADITGITVSGDLEAALKIGLTESLKFRPFAGLEIANTNYGDFKESGGGIYDLDTKGGNYLRSAGRVGAGLDYEKGIWIWYANVEGKYVFEGTKPEIESQFNGTGIDFYSRGADEKNVVIGAGAGGEVRISQHWKGFANAKYYIGEKYESIYGNIGVRYLFGKGKSKADEEAKRLSDEKAKLQAAQEAADQQAKLEAQRKADEAAALEAHRKAEEEKAAQAARRIAEEAAVTQEISDADLAKQKAEAEARRKRAMLKTYTLTMNFKTNSYILSKEDKERIDEIAGELNRLDYKKITIEGHTDNTGTKQVNKKLSRQRAKSVYDEFIEGGIPAEKMTYQGFADTMPVQSNGTPAGRSANRRTEIFVE